jgi:hypothetical protein
MAYKVCIYRALVACILLFSASCIQKQDALIVEYDGPPLIQFRCILVPESPAMVQSIKILGNAKNTFTDTIWYELISSKGIDKVCQAPANNDEYLSFTNTQVKHGETYILRGYYLNDTFFQTIKIPSQIRFSSKQIPNKVGDESARVQIEVENNNRESISVLFPVKQVDSDLYGRNLNNFSYPTELGFELLINSDYFNYKNTETIVLEKKTKSSFIFELPHFFSLNYVNTQYRLLDSIQIYNLFAKPLGNPVQINTKKTRLDTSLKLIICESKAIDLLHNMPEKYYVYNTNQFSNVPEFKLPVVTQHFRGYAVGYYYDIIEDFAVSDLSTQLAQFILINSNGDTLSGRSINSCAFNLRCTNINGELIFLTNLYQDKLTENQLFIIRNENKGNNKIKLDRIDAIDLLTNKRYKFVSKDSFYTLEQLSEHAYAKKPLYFYEQ